MSDIILNVTTSGQSLIVELTPLLHRVRLGVIRLFDQLRRNKKEKKKKIGKRELEREEEKIFRFLKLEIVIGGRVGGIVFSQVGQKPEVDNETWRITRVTGERDSKTGACRTDSRLPVYRDQHAR